MHTATLRIVDGSVMLAVPKPLLDKLDLGAGGTVGLTVENGRLILAPRPEPRPTLDDLLADHTSLDPRPQEERAWLDNGPAGREFL